MLFTYTVIDKDGATQNGSIDAVSEEVAINALQRRGFVITSIKQSTDATPFWQKNISFFDRVTSKDIVILSRQISTLFEAQISALRVFRLLADETENPKLKLVLEEISSDLQGGSTISRSMSKHSEVFSVFYVNMVKAGEESGKLDQIFAHLADYLDRTYEVTQKAKNALVYPAFVVFTFGVVMILMLTLVIPKISQILVDSGQKIPFYTQIVLGLSNFFINYGVFVAIALVAGIYMLFKFKQTDAGAESFDSFKLNIPYLGNLYEKLYLSRIADNMTTLLSSGIPMIKALELTSATIDNRIFSTAVVDAMERVKAGSSLSDAFTRQGLVPNIMVQMIKIGEETGKVGEILGRLSGFYRREFTNAVDTLVSLIEPAMIVFLGAAVGILLASVLIPIYNVASTF